MKNLKMLSKVVVVAALTALAVACSKGSGGSSPVNPYVYGNNCPTCYQGGPGTLMLSNVQFSTGSGGLQGILNLGGAGTQIMPTTYQGQVAPYPVAPNGNGMIQINSGIYCAAPGQYMITGISAGYSGSSNSGIMNGLQIQAQGPGGMIEIIAYSAEIVFSQNRLGIGQGQLVVNGQPCGSIATQ